MKDVNDKRTRELPTGLDMAVVKQKLAALGLELRVPQGRAVVPSRQKLRSRVLDEPSSDASLPKVAEYKPAAVFGAYGHFVPVSFVAKDWKVSPRRVRAMLAQGRLLGQLQPNGYWEVRYPYSFTLGTRGPALKRFQKPAKGLRLVADNTERRTE